MNKNDGERLVALETKMDTVLTNQKTQTSEFKELNKNLGELLPTFATKKELEVEVVGFEAKLEEVKKRHSLQVWLVGTLSMAFGILMTILISEYFK